MALKRSKSRQMPEANILQMHKLMTQHKCKPRVSFLRRHILIAEPERFCAHNDAAVTQSNRIRS